MKIRTYKKQTVRILHKTSHGVTSVQRVKQVHAGRKRVTARKETTKRWQPFGQQFRVPSNELLKPKS